MTIDPKTGDVAIADAGIVIGRWMKKSEFLSSNVGKSSRLLIQNAPYATYGFRVNTSSVELGLNLLFAEDTLESIHIARIAPGATWANWSESKELEEREELEKLLVSLLGPSPHTFSWGEAAANYDPRCGSSDICVRYMQSR